MNSQFVLPVQPTNPSGKRLHACFFLLIATPLPMGQSPYQILSTSLLVCYARSDCLLKAVFPVLCLLLPASNPLSRPAPGGAWRLKVIFARDAQYALVTICCQALRTLHVAFFF